MREAEHNAFAKACAYLNYYPVATRLTYVAAVGTGVLYVALLVVLWLFAELMVHRGRVPASDEMADADRERVAAEWGALPQEERKSLLNAVGVEGAAADTLATADAMAVSVRDQEVIWRAYVPRVLRGRIGDEAADLVTVPVDKSLPDVGVLSLVTRSHVSGRVLTPAVSWLARWNPWAWRWRRDAESPNYVSYLTGLMLLALGLSLVRALLGYVMRDMAARAATEAATRLRRAVYHHTFRLGTLAFRALGPSEAVTVFTRHIEAIHEALYTRLTVSLREPVKFALLLAFAVFVHPLLALACLLFAVLVWYVGGQAASYFRRRGRTAAGRAAEQLALIRESLMLMRLVKVYLMELFNQARVERLLARYGRAQVTRLRGEAVYKPLLFLLGITATLVMLYVAGLIVLHGGLGAASTVTLAAAMVSLYWPAESWLSTRRVLRHGREAAVVLFKFLERPGEVGQVVGAEFVPPMSERLEFDNVSLREPGSTRMLLQDVTFSIPAGQRVGLIGADELEKHALIYLIPRLLDPTSGEIRVDQHNLRWVTLDSLRNQIGLVLQNDLVFHDTIANNIGCGDQAYTLPRIIEAAKVAHAHSFIQKLPQGYETPIGELGLSLNASQKFRIALARAILRDPALVILEEPEQALDDDTKALLDDTFARFLPGRTTIFLPHRISTIRSCDRLLLLHNGRIGAEGDHRELIAHNALYRHLHYIEFNEVAEQV